MYESKDSVKNLASGNPLNSLDELVPRIEIASTHLSNFSQSSLPVRRPVTLKKTDFMHVKLK
jgi:hypothetical protein